MLIQLERNFLLRAVFYDNICITFRAIDQAQSYVCTINMRCKNLTLTLQKLVIEEI